MPQCKVHNVGFYKPEAKAIYSTALEVSESKLAVARSDATIEIWNLSHSPFIERTIVSSLENFSVEGLCWFDKRLFSVGLHGWLVEYNLYALSIKNHWIVTGEAATCLDASRAQIAVGTEQGYINIYRINGDEIQFEKLLDKQEGRIICLKFDKSGEFIVAGSINAIRIWNVKTGHAIHKMVLGRAEAKKDTVVWCLEVMSDFTIFSGDSRGVLTLWDGKIGSQIESHQSHKADITALCLDEKEESIYCAGVDPLIANYEKVKIGANVKWVKSIQRKIHDHDVRAMIFHKGRLYSAGIDSYLVCSYHPPKTLIKYAPILQNPSIQVTKPNLVLLRYSKHIEVWRLGEAKAAESGYRGALELTSKPKKVLVIQKLGKNWANEDEAESVVCASISANGEYVFLGTLTGFRLYECTGVHGDKPSVTKVDDLDDNNLPCVQATFNNPYKQLIIALSDGKIVVYDLEDGSPFISQCIEKNTAHLSDTVTFLKVSCCGKIFVAADNSSNIVVYRRKSDGYSLYAKLPRYNIPLTALGIRGSSSIIIAYANHKIHEFDLELKKYTDFSKHLDNYKGWKSKTHPVRNIVSSPGKGDVVFLHDDSSIIVMKKDKEPPKSKPKSKVAKKNEKHSLINGDVDDVRNGFEISIIQKYRHLVHLDVLETGDMVAVEVNPLSIIEKLPPAFAQKTFGNK